MACKAGGKLAAEPPCAGKALLLTRSKVGRASTVRLQFDFVSRAAVGSWYGVEFKDYNRCTYILRRRDEAPQARYRDSALQQQFRPTMQRRK